MNDRCTPGNTSELTVRLSASLPKNELQHGGPGGADDVVRSGVGGIKNNLQTVADLLLLGRPEGGEGRAFDDTAARIRSIATVHRLLTEADDPVDARALLGSVAEAAPVPVAVEAGSVAFDAATAQKVGIVANELITNAFVFPEEAR